MAEEDRQFLACRAAGPDDLGALLVLIGGENIASMIADEGFQRSRIEKSVETLSGRRVWSDGLLMLLTELHDGVSSAVAGSAGINTCAGGYWAEKPRGTGDVLAFESFPKAGNAFEFSGTCVAKAYRNRSIGTLHTVSRIMFLLMHAGAIAKDVGGIAYACANLLPPSNPGGSFPFYEEFVRPLLGGIVYRDADIGRYTAPGFFAPLLPGADKAGAELPLAGIKEKLGEDFAAVREQTRGAAHALAKFGFRQVAKYDALDAGHYVEATMDVLGAHMRLRELEPVPARGLGDLPQCYFAPQRPMAAFVCARAPARIDGQTLLVPGDIFDRLALKERVMVAVP